MTASTVLNSTAVSVRSSHVVCLFRALNSAACADQRLPLAFNSHFLSSYGTVYSPRPQDGGSFYGSGAVAISGTTVTTSASTQRVRMVVTSATAISLHPIPVQTVEPMLAHAHFFPQNGGVVFGASTVSVDSSSFTSTAAVRAVRRIAHLRLETELSPFTPSRGDF